MPKKLDRNYVSDIDKFLTELNQKVPLSAAQLTEIKKHERIFKARDTAVTPPKDPFSTIKNPASS